VTNNQIKKLIKYLAFYRQNFYYKSPVFLFLELMLVFYQNRFWCSERQKNDFRDQWHIFFKNQQLVEGWVSLKTNGIWLDGKLYILDLSNRDHLYQFFQLITGNDHDPEALNMLHKRLAPLFCIFKQLEKDLGPKIQLLDWASQPASHTRFVEPHSGRIGIAFSHKNLREKDFVTKEVYEVGPLEERDLTHWEQPKDLSFWDHWLPKGREWGEEEPFFKELELHPEFHEGNPCPEDAEPLEPDWKASEGITTLSSPNSLNNRNLCESFNGFEEVSPNGFCDSSLHKFVWLFEETFQSLDFFFSGLFWFIKFFLIMQRNSMFFFTKIKIKLFFLYCKKKFK